MLETPNLDLQMFHRNQNEKLELKCVFVCVSLCLCLCLCFGLRKVRGIMLFTRIQKAAENVPSGTGSSGTEKEDQGGGLQVYKLLFSTTRVINLTP